MANQVNFNKPVTYADFQRRTGLDGAAAREMYNLASSSSGIRSSVLTEGELQAFSAPLDTDGDGITSLQEYSKANAYYRGEDFWLSSLVSMSRITDLRERYAEQEKANRADVEPSFGGINHDA
tara:strand:+ start:439 stop:807 length:369 start_codon:yes stop_codon:yes gene_type:complete